MGWPGLPIYGTREPAAVRLECFHGAPDDVARPRTRLVRRGKAIRWIESAFRICGLAKYSEPELWRKRRTRRHVVVRKIDDVNVVFRGQADL
jgi:hypothetical protein